MRNQNLAYALAFPLAACLLLLFSLSGLFAEQPVMYFCLGALAGLCPLYLIIVGGKGSPQLDGIGVGISALSLLLMALSLLPFVQQRLTGLNFLLTRAQTLLLLGFCLTALPLQAGGDAPRRPRWHTIVVYLCLLALLWFVSSRTRMGFSATDTATLASYGYVLHFLPLLYGLLPAQNPLRPGKTATAVVFAAALLLVAFFIAANLRGTLFNRWLKTARFLQPFLMGLLPLCGLAIRRFIQGLLPQNK